MSDFALAFYVAKRRNNAPCQRVVVVLVKTAKFFESIISKNKIGSQ
jgi:hypothetical protein